jgi:hypothetical protein
MTLAASAHADAAKEQCIDANDRAQSLRRAGDFAGTRQLLRRCDERTCPALVRDDCAQRLDELERAQPTIVFDVHDEATGKDVVAVKITIDGKPFADSLDGRALAVDPGPHTFVFEVPGQPPTTERVTVREGEKGRHESVAVGSLPVESAPAPTPPPDTSTSASTSPPDSRAATGSNAWTVVGIVTTTVGAAALAAGGVAGILASIAKTNYEKNCGANIQAPAASDCNSAGVRGHDDAASKATWSTALFLGGGVAAVAGITIWVAAPKGREGRAAVTFVPGGVSLSGSF